MMRIDPSGGNPFPLNPTDSLNRLSPATPSSAEASADAAKETTFQEKLEAAAKKKDLEGLREASQEFEAYFLGLMLKQMRKTVLDGGLIEKSEARKQFESMLDEEYAKNLARKEGIGIAKSLYEAMRKAYE